MAAVEDLMVAAWVAEGDSRQARIKEVLDFLEGQGFPRNEFTVPRDS